MRAFIGCILLVVLFGIIVLLSFAQQEQTTQKPDPEIKALRKQVSELESKLQTVENVEKIELAAKLTEAQAKLADANAKLMSAEFGKFERKLRDSNDKWVRDWGVFFLAIIAVVGVAFWLVLKSLIANGIEKSLNGFKEAVGQVHTLSNELRILQKEHAVSMLENSHRFSADETYYREQIKTLPGKALLDVFEDETRPLLLRYKAVESLADRESSQLVFPVLTFLNSVVNSDIYAEDNFQTKDLLRDFVSFVGYIGTLEAYQGLKKFLNRLLTENPRHKGLFLTRTAFSLAYVSIKLNRKDSASILRKSIPDLNVLSQDESALKNLIEYFDRFNEPEGIKEILIHHGTNAGPEVTNKCLELLQKHDPDFVKEWETQKDTTNTQTKESS